MDIDLHVGSDLYVTVKHLYLRNIVFCIKRFFMLEIGDFGSMESEKITIRHFEFSEFCANHTNVFNLNAPALSFQLTLSILSFLAHGFFSCTPCAVDLIKSYDEGRPVG